jgi:hypothetical protein
VTKPVLSAACGTEMGVQVRNAANMITNENFEYYRLLLEQDIKANFKVHVPNQKVLSPAEFWALPFEERVRIVCRFLLDVGCKFHKFWSRCGWHRPATIAFASRAQRWGAAMGRSAWAQHWAQLPQRWGAAHPQRVCEQGCSAGYTRVAWRGTSTWK